MSTATTSLLDLTTEMNAIVLDAFADTNRRSLAYAKNVWSIVGSPVATSDPSETVTEALARLEQLNELTIAEVQHASQSAVELAQKIAGQADKARSQSMDGVRDLAKGGFSTVKSLIQDTEDRFEAVVAAPSAN